MSHSTQPLAKVKVTKMKVCLMLMARKITLLIMQSWTLACKHYKKHGEKKDNDIVSYVTEEMFEPHLVVWYQADQTQIDALSLDQYLTELSLLILEKNWAHDILETILSSHKAPESFLIGKLRLRT
jgi:hypothetical protein